MKAKKTKEPISVREAALRLGYTLQHVYHLIWRGRLRAEQKWGRWLVDPVSVEEWIKARRP